jgi:hypothetical protein
MGLEIFEHIMEHIVAIFIISIIIITGAIMISNFSTSVQTHPDITTEANETITKFNDRYLPSWDYAIMLFLVTSFIGSIILARQASANPWSLGIALIFLVFIVIGSAIIANIYDEMIAGNADFTTQDGRFTFTNYFMDNLVPFAIGYFIVISIVLFSGTGGGGASEV